MMTGAHESGILVPYQAKERATMTIAEGIARRKSVRAYLDRPVAPDEVDNVVEAGRWAPNAGPFHVTVLRRPELLQRLDEATHRAIMDSGLEFLIMRASLPGYRPLYGAPVALLLSSPAGPYATLNCAVAAENMLLQATELGLASCFIVTAGWALAADASLAEEVGLPKGNIFQCAVLLGHAAATDPYSSPERVLRGTVSYTD
jgi:FMN reductase [NAD(P)H]